MNFKGNWYFSLNWLYTYLSIYVFIIFHMWEPFVRHFFRKIKSKSWYIIYIITRICYTCNIHLKNKHKYTNMFIHVYMCVKNNTFIYINTDIILHKCGPKKVLPISKNKWFSINFSGTLRYQVQIYNYLLTCLSSIGLISNMYNFFLGDQSTFWY